MTGRYGRARFRSTKNEATLENMIAWMTSKVATSVCCTKHLPTGLINATQFLAMSAVERFKFVKENYACFGCLKRAGRGHNVSTCSRRRQCHEMVNGQQCKFYHHPLVHGANITVISSVTTKGQAFLPTITADIIGSRKVEEQALIYCWTLARGFFKDFPVGGHFLKWDLSVG
jgi:hypothetical protein